MASKTIPCKICGEPMCPQSENCRKCYEALRQLRAEATASGPSIYQREKSGCRPHRSEMELYARELGVSARTIRIMGGVEKLKKLTPEARKLLLFPTKVGHKCSLASNYRRSEFQKLRDKLAGRFSASDLPH